MPEPLSIVTGVLTLIRLTGFVADEIWKLHDGATVVNGTISGLQNDVKAFQNVLEAMRTAFERITAEGSSGHIGSLWESVAQSVADGKDGLEQLRDLITGINKDTKFLDDYRKHARFNRSEEKINRSRIHIQSCRDTLHLSLQTTILVNQQTFQNVAEQQVVPSLAELQDDVHRIARRLSKMMKSSQPTDSKPEGDAHQMTIKNLLECVRSAASVISDASTTVTVEREADTRSQRSQALSQPVVHQSIALRRWFESRSIYEYTNDQDMDINPPASVADVQPLDDGEEDADSDTDLRNEMTGLLLDRGKQKLVAGNARGAERLFLNSLEQLGSVQIGNKHGQALELEATEALYGMYYDQERWSLAEKMLSRRIAVRQRTSTDSTNATLADALSMARLLKAQNKNSLAHLHARRALKGYRKLQDSEGTESCLRLLIALCHADGSENDLDAYEIMLSSLSKDSPLPLETAEPGDAQAQDSVDMPAAESMPPMPNRKAPSLPDLIDLSDSLQSSSKANAEGYFAGLQLNLDETPLDLSSLFRECMHDPDVGDIASEDTTLEHTESLNSPPPSTILSSTASRVPTSRPSISTDATSPTSVDNDADTSECRGNSERRFTLPRLDRARRRQQAMRMASSQSRESSRPDLSNSQALSSKAYLTELSTFKKNIVLVGDTSVGKTHLATKFAKGANLESNEPTMFEKYDAAISINGISMHVRICDCGGLESYANLRQEAYRDADVVLICFSIANPDSLDNVAEAWKDEVRHHCPNVPFLLIGNQSDLRQDPKTVAALQQIGQHAVTEGEGRAVSQNIGAIEYIECSAKTSETVVLVFERATRAASTGRKTRKKKSFWRRSKS